MPLARLAEIRSGFLKFNEKDNMLRGVTIIVAQGPGVHQLFYSDSLPDEITDKVVFLFFVLILIPNLYAHRLHCNMIMR